MAMAAAGGAPGEEEGRQSAPGDNSPSVNELFKDFVGGETYEKLMGGPG